MKKIDEDALAEAYNRALSLEKSGDFDAAARAYAEVLALDPDDHGGAAVRLASMGRGETPEKAPDAYVATLFDQHAEVFENVLVDQLGYCVPLLVRQRFQALAVGRNEGDRRKLFHFISPFRRLAGRDPADLAGQRRL